MSPSFSFPLFLLHTYQMGPLAEVEEVDVVPDPDGRHDEQAEQEEGTGHFLFQ